MKFAVNLGADPTFAVIDYFIKPAFFTEKAGRKLVEKTMQEESQGVGINWGHIFPDQEFKVIIQNVAFYGPGLPVRPFCGSPCEGASFAISPFMVRSLSIAINDLEKKAKETAWTLAEWKDYIFED